MIPSSLYIHGSKVQGNSMGHGKQPLRQLRVQQLTGNPHFTSNAKEPTEEWVDAALIYDAKRGEEGPM